MQRYEHHPRLMTEEDLRRLPQSRWHPKLVERYPLGSKVELLRRMDNMFYTGLARIHGNTEYQGFFRMQPLPELLDKTETPFDIVGSVVIDYNSKQATLIMEDHALGKDTPFTFGKTTIIRHLLRMQPLGELVKRSLGITEDKSSSKELFTILNQAHEIQDTLPESGNLSLLTGDITFVGRSQNNEFVALAPVGVREDTIWDFARSAMRQIANEFNRDDEILTKAQLLLVERLKESSKLWSDVSQTYPITEIIILKHDPTLATAVEWDPVIADHGEKLKHLRAQLMRNPLYLSGQTPYWSIDPIQHEHMLNELFNGHFFPLPNIRYLKMRNPLDQNVLVAAADTIRHRNGDYPQQGGSRRLVN